MKDIKLIHGDCLEVMDRLIQDGIKVDMILTDPPYGTVKNMAIDGWKNKGEQCVWDNEINITDMFDGCNNLLRENGVCVLFSQEPYTSKLRTFQHQNLKFAYPLIWKKDHFANGLIAKVAPVNYFEDMNVFYKKYDDDFSNPIRLYAESVMKHIGLSLGQINTRLGHRRAEHFFYIKSTQFKLPTETVYQELIKVFHIDKMSNYITYTELKNINSKYERVFNKKEKVKSNILEYKKDYSGYHPTQKPVALLEDLINTYSNEGDLVLDFTMGSGSTGVACKNLKRKFIGIEIEEDYFKIAKERIDKA